MSKKTLGLILVLLALTVVLVIVALSTRRSAVKTPTDQGDKAAQMSPTPAVVGHTVLTLTQNPISPTGTSAAVSVNVDIDTGEDEVTAVQLEIAYDPKLLTGMAIKPGTFFPTPNVLPIGGVNVNTGRITFAVAPASLRETKSGTGTVAVLTFSPIRGATVTSTPITILDKSLVTARGVTTSVLKSSTSTTIMLSGTTQPSTPTTTTP